MDYHNEYKRVGDNVVHKYNIIGTRVVVYNAWEPSSVMGRHHSITTIEGKWYGQIGSKDPSPEVERLPAGSEERISAVRAGREEQYQRAYSLIMEAFPETANSRSRYMGEIETLGSSSVPLLDRPVPQTYADWVKLGEDIKAWYAEVHDQGGIATVDYNLNTISHEGSVPPIETNEAIANAKRWLLLAAGRLG